MCFKAVGFVDALAQVKLGGEAVIARDRKGDEKVVEPVAQVGFLLGGDGDARRDGARRDGDGRNGLPQLGPGFDLDLLHGADMGKQVLELVETGRKAAVRVLGLDCRCAGDAAINGDQGDI